MSSINTSSSSWSSSSSLASEKEDNNNINNDLNKLKHRLHDAGITNYRIISDEEISNNNNLIIAKSLVWCVNNEEYVMCVLNEKDYINERLLMEQIMLLSSCNSTDNDRKIDTINLADVEIAEYRSGYKVGAIPAIGHDMPMSIYVIDQGLLTLEEETMLCVGCGIIGYHLLISLNDIIEYSNLSLINMYIRPIAQRWVTTTTNTSTDVRADKINNNINEINNNDSSKSNLLKKNELLSTERNIIKVQNLLYKAAGKKKGGGFEDVKQIVQWIGDDFPKLMEICSDQNSDLKSKNAVHNAAWTGGIDTISYLLQIGLQYNLNLLDTISIGKGNYGKTPIFYALTRCRNDMVLHLLKLNCNLLIVNNKGQTPSSLAINHLDKHTCDELFTLERKQLEKYVENNNNTEESLLTSSFINYRSSHSDNEIYGDLDPRFIVQTDVNYQDDIKSVMMQYWKEAQNNENVFFKPSLRSIRTTTIESRTNYYDKSSRFNNLNNNTAAAAATATATSDEISSSKISLDKNVHATSTTDTTSTTANDSFSKNLILNVINEDIISKVMHNNHQEQQQQSLKDKVIDNNINDNAKKDSGINGNMNEEHNLPTLTLDHIFNDKQKEQSSTSHCNNTNSFVTIVDNYQSLNYFYNAILQFKEDHRNNSTNKADGNDDLFYIKRCWGLDCEWKPSYKKGEFSPVSTLQLSNTNEVFIIDLQTLCQSNMSKTTTTLTPNEILLSHTLDQIFDDDDENISLVGFGISMDMQKLIISFPHMPCFQHFASVIDLPTVARDAYHRPEGEDTETAITTSSNNKRNHNSMTSLQKTVRVLLNKRLNKSQQCSRWDKRPLTKKQIDYASLDAAVSPKLLRCMLVDNNTNTTNNNDLHGRLLSQKPHLRLSFRFLLLPPTKSYDDNNDNETYINDNDNVRYKWSIPNGRIIHYEEGIMISKQSWYTSKKVPDLPQIISISVNDQRRQQNHSRKAASSKNNNKHQQKQKKIKDFTALVLLKSIPGDIQDNLPKVGAFISGSKDMCIRAIVGSKMLQTYPNNTRFKYKTRSGVIELSNCVLLFINFSRHAGKYKNDFLNGGKDITFTIDPTKEDERLFIDYAATNTTNETSMSSDNDVNTSNDASNSSSSNKKKLFLFIRPLEKHDILFCGECRCVNSEFVHETKAILTLRLFEFNAENMMLEDVGLNLNDLVHSKLSS